MFTSSARSPSYIYDIILLYIIYHYTIYVICILYMNIEYNYIIYYVICNILHIDDHLLFGVIHVIKLTLALVYTAMPHLAESCVQMPGTTNGQMQVHQQRSSIQDLGLADHRI